jgi:hypothetical protein
VAAAPIRVAGILAPVSIAELVARLRMEGEHETYPPAAESDLAATERSIGRRLPPSFRAFQTEFSNGAYLFLLQEVSATGAGNHQIAAVQDARAAAISANPDSAVTVAGGGAVTAGDLIPFSLDHNANCWCFLAGTPTMGDEYPVAYYVAARATVYGLLAGFEAWLRRLVDEQDEVIRTLYDRATIERELGLG